jgi:hypothetical protein
MVVVPSGDAALKRGHAWTTLTPGRAYRVLRNQVSERLAVAAPTWSADGPDQRPIALAVSGPIGVVQAGWQPVVGAVSYTVEIASDPTFAVVVKELVVESPQFQTALSEGRYWARVTSVDEDGMDAPSSLPRALRVVRVALPHSAFMPEPGTLVVPQQGVLRILDTEGIELSVDKSGFWPAPHVLHGPTRAFHRLRLRLVGDPRSTTMVRLERRALHAWVSMTPAPSWPSDPVQVAVRLDDPSGRIEPSSVEPALEVLLAGKPIETIWERDGNVWRTHIRGRVLDAPSLLEVVARDDAGIPLGWGFLELVGGGRVSHSDR